MKRTSSVEDCERALANGVSVYAKNGMGDWVKVDAVYADGTARVADSLSGLNDGTIGELMTVDNPRIELKLRDLEVA
jgi:hypothetical protein